MSQAAPSSGLSRLRYIPALDGMRGLSLPGTILTHYALFLEFSASAPHWLSQVGPLTLNIQMFFVLSGALITSLLVAEHQRTGTVSLKSFYLRRSRRLGPALLATVVIIGVTELLWQGSRSSSPLASHPWLALGAVSLFVGNWVLFRISGGIGWLGPAWTLGIEEQFYLTWPILLVTALRHRMRRATLYLCFAVVLAAGLVTASVLQAHVGKWRAFYATPVQLPSILLGCVLGYELTTNPAGRLARLVRSRIVALAGFAGMVATSIDLVHHPAPLYIGGYAVYACFACLLIGHCFVRAADPTPITRVLGWRPFVVVGQISYEAYLVHVIVIIGMAQAFPNVHVYPMMVIDTIIVAAVSALFYYTVEQPVRRRGWKSAFAKRDPAGSRLGGIRVRPQLRRFATVGTLAAVIAVTGVGVVAARTASPGQQPVAPAAASAGTGSAKPDVAAHRRAHHHGVAVAPSRSVPAASGGARDGQGSSTPRRSAGCVAASGCVSVVVAVKAPRITQLLPAVGSVLGGTTVTIRGHHFTRHAKVYFDALRVRKVVWVNADTLRIVAPSARMVSVKTALAQLHGLQVDVRVTTAGGTSVIGVAGRYTYV